MERVHLAQQIFRSAHTKTGPRKQSTGAADAYQDDEHEVQIPFQRKLAAKPRRYFDVDET